MQELLWVQWLCPLSVNFVLVVIREGELGHEGPTSWVWGLADPVSNSALSENCPSNPGCFMFHSDDFNVAPATFPIQMVATFAIGLRLEECHPYMHVCCQPLETLPLSAAPFDRISKVAVGLSKFVSLLELPGFLENQLVNHQDLSFDLIICTYWLAEAGKPSVFSTLAQTDLQ